MAGLSNRLSAYSLSDDETDEATDEPADEAQDADTES
jgi:hypothetical protein